MRISLWTQPVSVDWHTRVPPCVDSHNHGERASEWERERETELGYGHSPCDIFNCQIDSLLDFCVWLLRAVGFSAGNGKWQMQSVSLRVYLNVIICYQLSPSPSLSLFPPPPATLMASFRARRHLSGIFGTCCEYFSSQLAARTVINGISVREQMWLKLPNQKHIDLYIRHLT